MKVANLVFYWIVYQMKKLSWPVRVTRNTETCHLKKKRQKRSHVAYVPFLFCFDLTDHNEQLFRITLKILFLIGVI